VFAISPSDVRKIRDQVSDEYKANIVYQVKTDGFVAAYCVGSAPSKGANLLQVLPKPN